MDTKKNSVTAIKFLKNVDVDDGPKVELLWFIQNFVNSNDTSNGQSAVPTGFCHSAQKEETFQKFLTCHKKLVSTSQ